VVRIDELVAQVAEGSLARAALTRALIDDRLVSRLGDRVSLSRAPSRSARSLRLLSSSSIPQAASRSVVLLLVLEAALAVRRAPRLAGAPRAWWCPLTAKLAATQHSGGAAAGGRLAAPFARQERPGAAGAQ
jgi:hypothetical protein